MKFLCCSDTHSLLPPPLDETDALAWLHAGDVYHHGFISKGQKLPSALRLVEWIESRKIPVFAVKGNHDCSFDVPFFDKAENATGRSKLLAPGLMLIGLGWSGGAYYDLPTESDMQRICDEARREWLLKSVAGDQYVFLTHYPFWSPNLYEFNSNPEGWMFECIREFIHEIKPLAIIQGHVHELMGSQLIYSGPDFQSLAVFPGPEGGILNIDKETSSASFEFRAKSDAKDSV